MAEEFLEEQLKRIREMTEQVSRVKALYDDRDLRNRSDGKGSAHERQAPVRKHTARDSSPRRAR